MAITQAITDTNYGFSFNEAYLKVSEVLIRPNRDTVRIDLRGYATKESRDLVQEFELRELELKEVRLDPESDDKEITRLEDELGKKPIGVFRDRLEISFETFSPFCSGFSKEKIIEGCYLYIKSLDKYKEGTDI